MGGNEKIAEFDFVATRCPIFLFVFRRVVEPSLLGGKKYVHLSTVQWPLHAVEQTQEKRKQEFCSSILLCFFFFFPSFFFQLLLTSCCRSFSLSTKQKAGVDPGKLLHASLLFMLPSGLVLISCGSLPLSVFRSFSVFLFPYLFK